MPTPDENLPPPQEVDYEAPPAPPAQAVYASEPLPVYLVDPSKDQKGSPICLLLGLIAAGCFTAGAYFPFIEQAPEAVALGKVIRDPFSTQWVKISLYILAGVTGLFALLRMYFTFAILSVGGWGVAAFAWYMLFVQATQGWTDAQKAAFRPGYGLYAMAAGGVLLLLAFLARPRRKRYG